MEPLATHADARGLLLEARAGVLSTLSLDVPGFPFGSVVPYCLDRSGVPLILIADIAQHTRNLLADPRASLTVAETTDGGDVQAKARLTCLARAAPLAAGVEDAADRYYRSFPWARDYHRTHGFAFFRLAPVRLRYIGGFGDIRWIEPEAFTVANPFTPAQEAAIVEHMNADHPAAMRGYVRRFKGLPCAEDEEVTLAGIDAEGFDLLLGRRLLHFPFDEPVATPGQARQRLVGMARGG
jgi:heme oxygenase (biliverdin-IX-beta and delta-forming)